MIEAIKNTLAVVSLTPTDGIMIIFGTVVIFILHSYMANRVFAPLLEHVEQRESLTSGALLAASQMRQKTQALQQRFEEAIFKARVEGNTKKSETVAAAKEQASKVIRDAENEAAKEVLAGREAIAKQLAQANTMAEAQARDLADQIASRVDSQLGY